jgi:hypothetical protein
MNDAETFLVRFSVTRLRDKYKQSVLTSETCVIIRSERDALLLHRQRFVRDASMSSCCRRTFPTSTIPEALSLFKSLSGVSENVDFSTRNCVHVSCRVLSGVAVLPIIFTHENWYRRSSSIKVLPQQFERL